MTVAAKPATISYIEDGVSVSFAVPFRFKAASDLVVERLIDGSVIALQLGTDFSVTGGTTDAGGTLTRTAATDGAVLRIARDTARAQPMTYATGDRFPAASHEEALDRQMLVAQEQDAVIGETRDRALMVPAGQSVRDLVPGPNTAVVFDENLDPVARSIGSFPAGPPGGNVMSVDPFTILRDTDVVIPAGTNRVRTSAFSMTAAPLASVGAADYVTDAVVTDAYVAANPLTSFMAPDESGNRRGFRLDEPILTPQMLGAKDDGSATAHAAFLALAGTSRDMLVPPGDYLIDNSEPRQINYYTGEMRFAPGARLIFTNLERMGLFFFGGSPTVRGVRLTTRDEPTTRVMDAAMLRFDFTTNAIASDIVVERGAGAGILVRGGTGFGGDNITIMNTLADGFDFFNHSQGRLSGLTAFNVGDDGLGCVSYIYSGSDPTDLAPQGNGLTLSDIQVRSTRTRGISFIGYANCTLNGFIVEDTQGDGVIIERDDPAQTHTPTGIAISNGVINNAGQRTIDPDYAGDRHGIKVGQSGSVSISDVSIVNAKSVGVAATSSEINAHLYITGVRVETAGDEGFYFYNHRSVTYGIITAQDTRVAGIRTLSVDRLIGIKRVAIRASKSGGNFRAIWDANNAFQDPGSAYIEDLRGPATGFTYRVEGTGRGSTGRVEWNQSGAFYAEFVAPYMTIPDRVTAKRDDVSPGAGDILLSPLEAWDRKIYAALTADIVVGLPTFGMAHGDAVSVSRYDGSGTYTISFQDRNNSNTVVTTIPPGMPMINGAWWDGVASRWRASGKTGL